MIYSIGKHSFDMSCNWMRMSMLGIPLGTVYIFLMNYSIRPGKCYSISHLKHLECLYSLNKNQIGYHRYCMEIGKVSIKFH